MTDTPTTMTTYERADGELTDDSQWWSSTEPFDNSEPTDVVEKHWVLTEHRTIRLGENELCKRCGGDGGDQSLRCEPCHGTGDQPRDDPPYTWHIDRQQTPTLKGDTL